MDLDAFDCGSIDVPELGGGNWWVFSISVDHLLGNTIGEWVEMVLGTIEKFSRRLSDDEWIVIIDRRSVFQ
jgi:hypothetical protein